MGAMPSLIVSGKDLDYIQMNNLPAGLTEVISFNAKENYLTGLLS